MLTRRSAVDPHALPVVLLDPALGTADSANAVDWFEASPTARSSPSARARAARRTPCSACWTPTGGDLGEAIPRTRACSVAWEPDGSGFAYTRYPEDDQYHRTVHHHVLGTAWSEDPVLWAEHDDPQAWPAVTMSPDGRWLLVHVLVGWARRDVHLLDRTTGTWRTIIEGRDGSRSSSSPRTEARSSA